MTLDLSSQPPESPATGTRRLFRVLAALVLHPAVFFLLAAAAILSSRSVAISYPMEINVDESLLLSQAPRYEQDLVPWRSVDTTTSGPLNTLPFYLLKKAGITLSYPLAHALAALVLLAVVILTWMTLRQFAESWAASLGSAALVLVICEGRDRNFVHFSSELIPIFLTSGAVFLLAHGLFRESRISWSWPAAALLLGAAPFAKLQALPISGALFLWIAWTLARRRSFRTLGLCAAAFSAVTIALVALLAAHSSLDDFWSSYLVRNLSYAGDGDDSAKGIFTRVWALFFQHPPVSELALGTLAFAVAWILSGCAGLRAASAAQRSFFSLVILYSLAAFGSVLRPVYGFPHYDFFLFQPLALLASSVLILWQQAVPREGRPHWSMGLRAALCFTITALGFQWLHLADPQYASIAFDSSRKYMIEGFEHRIAMRINALPRDNEFMGIWGWAPALYLETGMTPASRHSLSHYLIDPHPLRDRFRQQFLEDLERDRPAIFVDAVSPGCFMWHWNEAQGMESFPALAEFIARDYHLVDQVGLVSGVKPVRIFARNGPGIAGGR